MKKALMIIGVALLLVSSFGAQAQVTEFGIDASGNSIIRSIKDRGSVIYTEDASGSGCFMLYYDSQSGATAFRLPYGVRVRDVRIWQDSLVYFCGTLGGAHAVVGMFGINNLFVGGGSVNMAFADWTSDGQTLPADMKRLDLFDGGSGYIGMAMVGDALFDTACFTPTTTVVSAIYDGSIWSFYIMVRKPSKTRFTDIACLDNVIVASASDTNGQSCRIKTFKKVDAFPLYPYVSMSVDEINFGSPVGDVLVAHQGGDTAVVAHYDTSSGVSTVFHRLDFVGGAGSPALPIDTWVSTPSSVAYGSTWEMMELASDGDTVNLLQRAAYPVFLASLGYWIVRTALPSSTVAADMWLPIYGRQQSMDLDVLTQLPRTSEIYPEFITYGPTWNTGCNEDDTVTMEYTSTTKVEREISEYGRKVTQAPYFYSPALFGVPARIICE